MTFDWFLHEIQAHNPCQEILHLKILGAEGIDFGQNARVDGFGFIQSEPGTLLLMAAGLGWFGLKRRRVHGERTLNRVPREAAAPG